MILKSMLKPPTKTAFNRLIRSFELILKALAIVSMHRTTVRGQPNLFEVFSLVRTDYICVIIAMQK